MTIFLALTAAFVVLDLMGGLIGRCFVRAVTHTCPHCHLPRHRAALGWRHGPLGACPESFYACSWAKRWALPEDYDPEIRGARS